MIMYAIYANNAFVQAYKILLTIWRIRTQYGNLVQSTFDQHNIRASTIVCLVIKMAKSIETWQDAVKEK